MYVHHISPLNIFILLGHDAGSQAVAHDVLARVVDVGRGEVSRHQLPPDSNFQTTHAEHSHLGHLRLDKPHLVVDKVVLVLGVFTAVDAKPLTLPLVQSRISFRHGLLSLLMSLKRSYHIQEPKSSTFLLPCVSASLPMTICI